MLAGAAGGRSSCFASKAFCGTRSFAGGAAGAAPSRKDRSVGCVLWVEAHQEPRPPDPILHDLGQRHGRGEFLLRARVLLPAREHRGVRCPSRGCAPCSILSSTFAFPRAAPPAGPDSTRAARASAAAASQPFVLSPHRCARAAEFPLPPPSRTTSAVTARENLPRFAVHAHPRTTRGRSSSLFTVSSSAATRCRRLPSLHCWVHRLPPWPMPTPTARAWRARPARGSSLRRCTSHSKRFPTTTESSRCRSIPAGSGSGALTRRTSSPPKLGAPASSAHARGSIHRPSRACAKRAPKQSSAAPSAWKTSEAHSRRGPIGCGDARSCSWTT